jgi:hypothetical protein
MQERPREHHHARGSAIFQKKIWYVLNTSLSDPLQEELIFAGTFFASRVELGGRLHSSESSDSSAEGKVEERARALKISAAASFSSTYAQGSASGSKEDSSNHSSNRQNSSLSNNLAWEAKGGDTLLCNKWVALKSSPMR